MKIENELCSVLICSSLVFIVGSSLISIKLLVSPSLCITWSFFSSGMVGFVAQIDKTKSTFEALQKYF